MFDTPTPVTARLLIGGIGISPALHVTPQLLARISKCDRIFVAAVTRNQLEEALRGHDALVSAIGDPARTFFLHEIYASNVDPRENYARAVERIAAIVDSGVSVAFLTLGHPLYWDSVSRGLIQRLGGTRVEVVPGISSLDTIVADTRMEIEPFFVVLDASFAVSRDVALDTRATYLFVQPHRVQHETVINTDDELRASSLVFQRYLRRYLPVDTTLLVGRSPSVWETLGTMRLTDVAGLHEIPLAEWLGCSVLIERRD